MEQKIYAHRGASAYAPENTLSAFRLAAEMGADGVELDVQMTRDGALVVAHDERLERVSDGKGWLKDHTLAELRALRFNRVMPGCPDARIPTLDEVFRLLGDTGLGINIELKNSLIPYEGMEEKVLALAKDGFPAERLIISSFSHASILRVKRAAPEMQCGLLYDASLVRPWAYALALGAEALHPHFAEVITPGGECAAAHRAGVRVHTWTVNEPEDMEKVLREGADILITNYPDRALEIRRRLAGEGL